MVWLACLYAAGGADRRLRHRHAALARATERRQAAEADMRFSLAQARENALALALAEGESSVLATVAQLFTALAEAWHRQTECMGNLNLFQSAYITLAPVFPILGGGAALSGLEITLGGLMQTGQGFQQVVAALSWPVDNAARLAEWRASAERILALAEAVRPEDEAEGIIVTDDGEEGLEFDRLALREPEGRLPLRAARSRPHPARRAGDRDGRATASGRAAARGGAVAVGRRPGSAGARAAGWRRCRARPGCRKPPGRCSLAPPGGASAREVLISAPRGGGAAWCPRASGWRNWQIGPVLEEQDRYRLAFARLLLRWPDLALLEEPASVVGRRKRRRWWG